MGQQTRISKNNTKVERVGAYNVVTLHGTPVVKLHSNGTVTLNSGGWRTATTKTRINQVATEWGLGFRVHQDNYRWNVSLIDPQSGHLHKPRGFMDGMTFSPDTETLYIGGVALAW